MPALRLLLIDIISWIGIYGLVNWARAGAAPSSSFEFALLDVIQLVVIVQALYIIGGYDRHIEMRSLSYTAEHLLSLAAAAVFTSFLIYSAATFDQTMKPSRGVLLLSFLAFAPLSLMYRRWVRRSVATATATKAYLVIGTGEAATRFYEAYKNSPNMQQLHFVDLNNERVGQAIAGEGTPIIEANYEEKLNNPTN